MNNYLLFLFIASATVLSPGPGVILTLSNSIRYGFTNTIGGILGVAIGTFIVAAISATSLGILLTTSSLAFMIMKYIGAAYLFYLGIKLWRAPVAKFNIEKQKNGKKTNLFFKGLLIQVTNPKAVFFFMSVFPQFIDYSKNFKGQFSLLVVSYSILVVIIHMSYALLAKSARTWLTTPTGGRLVNKLSGTTFICFGTGLAAANE